MQWHDLLFAHWPLRPDVLRPLIPPSLALDTFEGDAWLGVVPFRMAGVRQRLSPPLPHLSAFPELNVRTYVVAGGKPGVWFFSLDAANPLAVHAARFAFHLPYFNASMRCDPTAGGVRYASVRTHRGAPPAELRADYGPIGPVRHAARGSLEAWLTDRYCLYSANRAGRVWRAEVDHARWPLQPAWADVRRNTMASQIGIGLATPPLLHFSRRLDVIAWGIEPVRAPDTSRYA